MAKASHAILFFNCVTLNTLKVNPKSLFIDYKTLLVLYKLHHYEQLSPQKKENLNPTQNWKQI